LLLAISFPKFVPAIVIVSPFCPVFGVIVEIVGGNKIVNEGPFMFCPAVVKTIKPLEFIFGTINLIVVILEKITLAATPLTETLLFEMLALKFVPVIVIVSPALPDSGETLTILGTTGTTGVSFFLQLTRIKPNNATNTIVEIERILFIMIILPSFLICSFDFSAWFLLGSNVAVY
jgi:hypothetical protein